MREALHACLTLLALSWRTSRRKLLVAAALMLAQTTSMPLAAPALAMLTDAALEGNAGRASLAAVLVALCTIASLTASHFAHVAYFELGEANYLLLAREVVDLANGSAGLEHHERPEYADKVQVLRQELERVSWVSMTALLSALSLGTAILVTGVLLALVDPWLLLLPLAAVPPLLTGRRAEAVTAAAREKSAEATRLGWHLFQLATDAGAGKELRACGVQQDLVERRGRLWDDATRVLWRGEVRAALWRVGGQLVFAAGYVAGTLLVVSAAVSGERSVGDVVLAIVLAVQVNQQVVSAVTVLQEVQRLSRTLADLRWMRELADAQAPPPPDAEVPARLEHGIALRGVSFGYPGTDRPVLGGVDLLLPAGSSVALVGENGAGKTSLVKLLCRFYEPTAGAIEVDGVDLRRMPLEGWREAIAAGFQDFVRFEFVARETVGVGDLSQIGSADAVQEGLRRARAEDVLARLDDGLETRLGTTYAAGTQLSGGQWQKLALGRAMMRTSPLLVVLDEPTSALDAQAEHALFEQYTEAARRLGERTGAITLLVSHRFSTVRRADLILVVADGRVAEAGTHEELMALGGSYAQLYELQAAQYR